MPCDTVKNVEPVVRKKQIEAALERLEKALKMGKVTVTIDKQTGAVAFTGWKTENRDFVTDVCAYRHLTVKKSWELRKAVAKAEAIAGRKVSMAAVGAGTHSHDGGKTWNPGH